MTPQERELVTELFDRLAELENSPRDDEAERAIKQEARRAPNALYALVQTVLVQDEALKAADARIAELEAAFGPEPAQEKRGFLDSMRDSLFGREERRGSVPTVRSGEPMGVPPGYRREADYRQSEPMGGPMPQEQGRGGSFLGTAAAAAAGVVGGAILLNSIRSALGGHQQGGRGPFAGTFDQIAPRQGTPWGGDASGSDLARQAGLNDIGGSGRSAGAYDSPRDARSEGTGHVAETENDDAEYEAEYEEDGDEEEYEDEGGEEGDEGGWDSDDTTET